MMSTDAVARGSESVEAAGVDGFSASTPDLTPDVIAGEVERCRLARLFHLDRLIAKHKLERECLASQIRAQMNRDAVVRHKIPGVGTVTLLPGRELKFCENCSKQHGLGSGTLDPYLKIEPEK